MSNVESTMTPNNEDGELLSLLSEWLEQQRWFPARGRDFTLRVAGSVELDDPRRVAELQSLLVAVDSPNAETAVVHVPLAMRPRPLLAASDDEQDEADAALIGLLYGGSGEPTFVYDGTHDPAFVTAWLEMVRRGNRTGGAEGRPLAEFAERAEFVGPLSAGVLGGEQSNTSVVVGSAEGDVIIKFFRVPVSGVNPDVELGSLLTQGGSEDVAQTLGEVVGTWDTGTSADEAKPESGSLSVIREFIPGSKDAWRIASIAAIQGRDFTREAREIGRTTARVHASLRSVAGTRFLEDDDAARFTQSLRGRVERGWRAVGSAVGDYDEQIDGVLSEMGNIRELPVLQRIHGDYHLGQVLRSKARGWTVLDFEGEPLRAADERSQHDVALRDIVGMLRSFDYAAGVADHHNESDEPTDHSAWARSAREAFLEGYAEESGETVDTNSALFKGLWLDKALYEVAYEQQNRPSWIPVPARAVREVLESHSVNTVDDVSESHPATENTAAAATPVVAAASAGTVAAASSSVSDATAAEEQPAPARMARDIKPLAVSQDVLQSVGNGEHFAPHSVLGAHLHDNEFVTIRVRRPFAKSVEVITKNGSLPMHHEHAGVWTAVLKAEVPGRVPDYRISTSWNGDDNVVEDDPYRHLPTLGEMDMHLIGEGRHERLWDVLGAHVQRYSSILGETVGVSFAVWAPNAQSVRVKGTFNNWDGSVHAMRSLGHTGIWEIFVPGAAAGDVYKFEIRGQDGQWRDKADPLARATEIPPLTGSVVEESNYAFGDDEWMERRTSVNPHNGPMSVYEVHLGSWRPGLSYREMAHQLAEYVGWQGFTHVEFLPVAEHPFGGSWGYQVTGYYAPTSRFGSPDDFRYLVDTLHQAGIGVIVDWVPAHFPKDEWALAKFDGQPLYEHPDPRRGEHPDWGTLIFDFGRNEVRNFLVANALYWFTEFHIDGLRVDAVASMLYLDYSREHGQWEPNAFGGRENLEAITFLQEVNATSYRVAPGTVMIAEESTAFDGVTRPTNHGGLGFGIKWNMGWMHDTLEYIQEDPINRAWHHDKMTFGLVYAWTENFILPISHDEVVHGKGSLLRKMPGDRWKQLANVRAYLAFQWTHPGKQLIFMGTEYAQDAEWSEAAGLDWWLTEKPEHKGVQHMVKELNRVYTDNSALWELDNDPSGFQWIDSNDSAGNTLAFVRRNRAGEQVVVALNFSGAPREGYILGLPAAGEWEEIFNSDDAAWGGSGVVAQGAISATNDAKFAMPASATVTLPPLGAVIYRVKH